MDRDSDPAFRSEESRILETLTWPATGVAAVVAYLAVKVSEVLPPDLSEGGAIAAGLTAGAVTKTVMTFLHNRRDIQDYETWQQDNMPVVGEPPVDSVENV